jgi:hypothetical protein
MKRGEKSMKKDGSLVSLPLSSMSPTNNKRRSATGIEGIARGEGPVSTRESARAGRSSTSIALMQVQEGQQSTRPADAGQQQGSSDRKEKLNLLKKELDGELKERTEAEATARAREKELDALKKKYARLKRYNADREKRWEAHDEERTKEAERFLERLEDERESLKREARELNRDIEEWRAENHERRLHMTMLEQAIDSRRELTGLYLRRLQQLQLQQLQQHQVLGMSPVVTPSPSPSPPPSPQEVRHRSDNSNLIREISFSQLERQREKDLPHEERKRDRGAGSAGKPRTPSRERRGEALSDFTSSPLSSPLTRRQTSASPSPSSSSPPTPYLPLTSSSASFSPVTRERNRDRDRERDRDRDRDRDHERDYDRDHTRRDRDRERDKRERMTKARSGSLRDVRKMQQQASGGEERVEGH